VQSAIRDNFQLATKYCSPEDYIYKNILEPRNLV
jgi:hypothetical protein